FHAFETPYLFQFWDANDKGVPNQNRFVEASGWGYADFDKGELVFKDYPISRLAGDDNDRRSVVLPVASDYYIFDDCLDGELWNLGGRLASLTIQVDVDKANIRKIMSGNLTGLEAVYAQMLTDVAYDAKENWDEFTLDLGGFIGTNVNDIDYEYDYDWFRDEPMAIVVSVSDDMVTVNYDAFGENDGEFCLLDKCKVHTLQNYTFLKDGKLQDASCLKLNDVVYFAGYLASPVDARPIELYVVFTPKAGTFDQLLNGPQAFGHYGINLSGTDYLYCSDQYAHEVSYDGGYTEGNYKAMRYTELRAKLTDKDFDGSCLYTVGYGKKYVASLIFAAKEINRGYGVITDFNPETVYPDLTQYYATALDFFGPDGKNTGDLALDTVYPIGANWWAYGDNFLGWLDNYYLDKDGKVILEQLGDVYKNDVGFVPFAPGSTTTVTTNANGRFEDYAALNSSVKTTGHSFEGMAITANTVVFEVSAKLEWGGFGPPRVVFDSVKLGDASDYIDAEFTVRQMDIFAWSGNKVDVLYVVNPHFNGEVLMGTFSVSRVDSGGYFFTFEDGTELRYNDVLGWAPTDGELFYGVYKTKDGTIDYLRAYMFDFFAPGDTYYGINPGDMVLLFDKDGAILDPDFVEIVLLKEVSGAAYVEGLGMNMDYDDVSVNDLLSSTEYIDMTGDGDFDYDFFATGHGDAGKYRYVTVRNAGTEILKVFRFNKPGII
ncbi:MAG: hypothetical protein IJH59_05075, partial [Firmicutes bacterium]|nr:hypothetical protein [Bacillota bacterium]